MGYSDEKPFSILLGKTITEIKGAEIGNDEIYITCSDGTKYKQYHSQSCCECVDIDDIVGDINDLINSPITMAEEIESVDEPAKSSYTDSFTWTFYKLATVKGYVTIKWYGTSNGYYSESVSFEQINQ